MKAKVIKTNLVTNVKQVQQNVYEDEIGRRYSGEELNFNIPFTEFTDKEWGVMRYETAQKAALCLLGQGNLYYNKQIPAIAVEFANDLINELKNR